MKNFLVSYILLNTQQGHFPNYNLTGEQISHP